MDFVFEAFTQLTKSREYSGGIPQALRIRDMHAWLEINSIDDTELRADFVSYIQALDEVWTKLRVEQIKNKREEQKTNKEQSKQQ